MLIEKRKTFLCAGQSVCKSLVLFVLTLLAAIVLHAATTEPASSNVAYTIIVTPDGTRIYDKSDQEDKGAFIPDRYLLKKADGEFLMLERSHWNYSMKRPKLRRKDTIETTIERDYLALFTLMPYRGPPPHPMDCLFISCQQKQAYSFSVHVQGDKCA